MDGFTKKTVHQNLREISLQSEATFQKNMKIYFQYSSSNYIT